MSIINFYTFVIIFLFTSSNGRSMAKSDPRESISKREADYLLKDGNFNFKRISDSNIILMIESSSKGESFGKDELFVCRASEEWNNDDTRNKFETSIFINSEGKSVLDREAELEKVDLQEYFIYEMREFWLCSEKWKKDSKTFLRIVNTLISIKPIGGVIYYDTVQVSSVNYATDGAVAKIKEIKYTQIIDGKLESSIRFEGFLETRPYPDGISKSVPHQIKFLHPLPISQLINNKAWIPGDNGGPSQVFKSAKQIEVSKSGKSLKIGATIPHVVSEGNGLCFKAQEVNPFPQKFMPEIYEDTYDTSGKIPLTNVKIGDKDFSTLFVIVTRSVSICRHLSRNLYLVENEVVSKIEVKKITIDESVKLLYSIKLAEKRIGVRFRQAKFYDIESGRQAKLENPVVGHVETSLVFSIFNDFPNKVDLDYSLSSKAIYRTFISSKGYNFRVGSKRESHLGQTYAEPKPIETFKCTAASYSDSYKTTFKVIINEDDEIQTMIKLTDEENIHNMYYQYTSQEVWECKNKKTKFLRVVNKLDVLVPVHEIETFDNVDIFYYDLSTGKKSVKIIEKKYLHPETKRVLVIDGLLEFDKDSMASISKTCEDSIGAIPKSTDETAPLIGYTYNEQWLLMKDRDPLRFDRGIIDERKAMSAMLELKNENVVLDFRPTSSLNKSLDENEIAICEWISEEKILPQVEVIHLVEKKRVSETIGMRDDVKQSRFIESDLNEVWQCTLPNDHTPSTLRIVNKLHFKSLLYEVHYKQKIDNVWFELENAKYLKKMESVHFVNKPDDFPINFDGKIILEQKKGSGVWKSGTEVFSNNEGDQSTILDIADSLFSFINYGRNTKKSKKQNNKQAPDYKFVLGEVSYYPNRHLRTLLVQNGNRMFQIGSKWQKEIAIGTTPINCQEIPPEVVAGQGYIPRVMEYIDGKLHRLDEDTLNDAFHIEERKVWLCEKDQKRFLRFFTALCGIDGFLAVRYHDGVEVRKYRAFGNVYSAQVTETIYIDPDSRIVLKYEGDLYSNSDEKRKEIYCKTILNNPPGRDWKTKLRGFGSSIKTALNNH